MEQIDLYSPILSSEYIDCPEIDTKLREAYEAYNSIFGDKIKYIERDGDLVLQTPKDIPFPLYACMPDAICEYRAPVDENTDFLRAYT